MATEYYNGSEWITISGGGGEGGVSDYEALSSKPQINGVTLSGDKTANDLQLAAKSHSHTSDDVTGFANVAKSGSYNDTDNKPQINGTELSGNKTAGDLQLASESHTHETSDITDFPTNLSHFTDDLGNNPRHTHTQYFHTISVNSEPYYANDDLNIITNESTSIGATAFGSQLPTGGNKGDLFMLRKENTFNGLDIWYDEESETLFIETE